MLSQKETPPNTEEIIDSNKKNENMKIQNIISDICNFGLKIKTKENKE